jgi:hypothetical protein
MKNYRKELPIRSKIDLAQEVGQIIHDLSVGKESSVEALIEQMKNQSIDLDETIQGDVLVFSEAVQYQLAYDPWHEITPEIERAANQLIRDLGFVLPQE